MSTKPEAPIVPRSLEVATTLTVPRLPSRWSVSALTSTCGRCAVGAGPFGVGGRRGRRAAHALAVAGDLVGVVGVDAVGAVAAGHGVGQAVAHAHVVVARSGGDVVDAEAAGDRVVAGARRRRDRCRRRRRACPFAAAVVSRSAPGPPRTCAGSALVTVSVSSRSPRSIRRAVTPARGQKTWISQKFGASLVAPGSHGPGRRRRRRSGRAARRGRRGRAPPAC